MKLEELARLIGAEVQGNPGRDVCGVSSMETAGDDQVTLVADAPKLKFLVEHLEELSKAVLVVPPGLRESAVLADRDLLVALDARLAFARTIAVFHGKSSEVFGVSEDLVMGEGGSLGYGCSIHPRVTIGRHCRIGNSVTLHPGVVLGDRVLIGDGTTIFANVSVYGDCEIGARCRIHSGVVIGADGFGFTPDEDGRQVKFLHLGKVIIEDEVEIGANCCVDRAGFGETRIRRGAKFDNLIQIGHNCEIGEDTVVAALTGFSGGTKVGRNAVIAGQVGTNQHISIGDRAIVTARTGVTKSVEAGRIVGGLPVQDHMKWRRLQALIARLPELFDRVKRLEGSGSGEPK